MTELDRKDPGVPLGYSRDYDDLPLITGLHDRQCPQCYRPYQDGFRQMSDGCQIEAIMCQACRAKARDAWIAEHPVVVTLPKMIVVRR